METATKTLSPIGKGRTQGFIRAFDRIKGFGFINADDGEEFFFHILNVRRGGVPLGGRVSFIAQPNRPKRKAVDVEVEEFAEKRPLDVRVIAAPETNK